MRKSLAFSDPGYTYSYRGASHEGEAWPIWLLAVREDLSARFNQPFELCVLNAFTPSASLTKHADDEKTIVPNSTIVSVSVGRDNAIEIFDLDGKLVLRFVAQSGSLYAMQEAFQKFLMHGVPQSGIQKMRYSLTFRHMKPEAVKQGVKRKQLTKKKKKEKKSKVYLKKNSTNPGPALTGGSGSPK